MSVRCSRAALASFPASSASSSAVHRPSFGRGWTSRSYANDVAPDRTTLRTVFRDTRRSRAISLIALPLRKYSRRIRPIVSTVSIPHYPRLIRRGQRITPHGRGATLDADTPDQGVKIARRNTDYVRLVLLAVALLATCVTVQSLGMLVLIRWLSRVRRVLESRSTYLRVALLLRLFVGIVLLHLVQVGLWAVVFWRAPALPNVETALYFSLAT